MDVASDIRILAIGDPHFKVDNVNESELMASACVREASNCHPDIIVELGDTLDKHSRVDLLPLRRATTFLEQLSEVAPTYVLIGNHDRINNRDFLSDIHPFVSCKIPSLTIISSTLVKKIKSYWFVFVPYVAPGMFVDALKRGDYREMLEDVAGIDVQQPWLSAAAIFAHQEFKGAKMGAFLSAVGDEWSLSNPTIISGHVHDYHRPQCNIVYVGTPIQHGFHDDNNKGISLFTLNKIEENSSIGEQRISLGIPTKSVVHLSLDDIGTYQPSNKLVKIVIRETSSRLKIALKSPIVKQWTSDGYKVSPNEIPEPKLVTDVTSEANPVVGDEPINFGTLFYEALEDDLQRQIFHECFGAPQLSTYTPAHTNFIMN